MNRPFRTICAVAAILCSAGPLGCTTPERERLREFTYPREFHYVETSEIRTRMAHLAWRVHELDRSLAGPAPPPRERTLELLRGMERELRLLGRGGWPANHPGFGHEAEGFRYELERARRQIERDPPNYFWARTISQVCLRCHGYETNS